MHRQCISGLLGCNIYVSEGRNMQLIRSLQGVCSQYRNVMLANTFVDAPYNRTGLTLVSPAMAELSAAAAAVAALAVDSTDMCQHVATHPRLGAVDHISCHPLGAAATLQHAADLAHAIGSRLAGPPVQLPVYYYGQASSSLRRLADIRRQLGYFTATSTSPATAAGTTDTAGRTSPPPQQTWQGALPQGNLGASLSPDAGPATASPSTGIITIGAVPWVVNYNVPLKGSSMAAAKSIAREVSERGGGLPAVEAMALQHDHGLEVACNLLQWQLSGPEEVQQAVEAAAHRHGMAAKQGYVIGHLPTKLCHMAEVRAQQQSTEG